MTNVAIKTEPANEMQIAFKALDLQLPVSYHIEELTDQGELIEVVFIDKSKIGTIEENDQWVEARILKNNLRKHIFKNELNKFTFDSSDNEGGHVQVTSEMPVNEYLQAYMQQTVKSYLDAGKTFIAFSSAIESLYAN